MRLQGGLVVGQTAFAVMLLIGTSLMIGTVRSLQSVDTGFRPENILTARLWLKGAHWEERENVRALQGTLTERAAALPGIKAAALVDFLPLNHENASVTLGLPQPAEGAVVALVGDAARASPSSGSGSPRRLVPCPCGAGGKRSEGVWPRAEVQIRTGAPRDADETSALAMLVIVAAFVRPRG